MQGADKSGIQLEEVTITADCVTAQVHSNGVLSEVQTAAAKEHQAENRSSTAETFTNKVKSILTFHSTRAQLERHFSTEGNDEGKQITQYFNFLNIVQINNGIMSVWCLIGWLPHAINVYGKMNSEGMPMGALGRTGVSDILFLSTFQPSSDGFWTAMICLSTVTMFATAPIYYCLSKWYLNDEQQDEDNDPETVAKQDRTPNFDVYQEKRARRRLLKFLSYSILAAICGIPAAVNYGLLFGLNQKSLKEAYQQFAGTYSASVASPSSGLGILSPSSLSVVVVVVKTVSDLLFEVVATVLTNMEKHISWSSHRYHRLCKLVIFRLVNTMSLFIIRYYADAPFYPCESARIAYQVFILVLLELTLNNIAEIGWSVGAIFFINRQNAGRNPRPPAPPQDEASGAGEGATPDVQNEPVGLEIELTDDYFEVVYRQYLMMAFTAVFPLICVFNLACNLVEWPLDKFRFVYLSKRKVTGNFENSRQFLTLLLFLSSLAGLVHFPSGPIWFAPPVGPYLCWPCNTFAQMTTASGSCLPHMEPSQCQDYTGASIGQDVIQGQITALVTSANATAPAAVAARAWFEKNDHLFRSRRCGCSPCNLVLACACDKPPVQRLGAPPNVTAPRSNFSFDRWSRAGGNASKRAGCGDPAAPECWTCPEAFTEYVDPVLALDRWRKIYFCNRCLSSPCVCDPAALGCAVNYEQQWQLAPLRPMELE